MYRFHLVTALAIIAAGVAGATCARATVRVGDATVIESDVSGSLSGQTLSKQIIKGDDVYESELIRTAADSKAEFILLDTTKIGLGPTTRIKIDRIVFDPSQFPNQSVRALTVSAGAGAMRWISGNSKSSAYQINTSTATIRVEGTTFDLLVEKERTLVLLQAGRVEVCAIDAPRRCKTLSSPGDMVLATPGALAGPVRGGPGLSEFEDRCLSAAGAACVITAGDNPSPRPSSKPSGGTKRAEARPGPGPVTLQSHVVPSEPSAVVVSIPTRGIYFPHYFPPMRHEYDTPTAPPRHVYDTPTAPPRHVYNTPIVPLQRTGFPQIRNSGQTGVGARLPQMAGGSASALSLSRPAQASLTLRPVRSLSWGSASHLTVLH